MKRSDTIGSLAKAKAAAQAEMKNPVFDSTNPHFKSKFASLKAVREAVLPAFTKHGISVSQDATSADGGVNIYTVLTHESGEWEEYGPLFVPCKQDAHGIGSGVTYGKRYHLQAVTLVVGDDDDDANGAVGMPQARQPDPFTHDPVIVGKFKSAADLVALQTLWQGIPANLRARYADLKDEAKERLTEAAHA